MGDSRSKLKVCFRFHGLVSSLNFLISVKISEGETGHNNHLKTNLLLNLLHLSPLQRYNFSLRPLGLHPSFPTSQTNHLEDPVNNKTRNKKVRQNSCITPNRYAILLNVHCFSWKSLILPKDLLLLNILFGVKIKMK